MKNMFFFYGSLMQGYWNNRILDPGGTKIGTGKTVAFFDLYVGKFGPVPCVVPNAHGAPLCGELWQLDDEAAMRVRRLEMGYHASRSDSIVIKRGTGPTRLSSITRHPSSGLRTSDRTQSW
jgi:gamma-glutamylcyclotransferase (GGCT)/AIG2-like uncharacterized protein YtfP